MTRTKRTTRWTLLLISLMVTATAGAQSINTTGMLARIDDAVRFADEDFSAVMNLVSEDPEDGIERTGARLFRRDQDGAYVILVLHPEVNRGQGYLQVDDALWFYDPESRSFSFTTESENFQGSDARVSDFSTSSFEEDYRIVSAEEGRLGNFSVYVLDLEATNNQVTYPFQRIWVTQDNFLVLKSEDYSVTRRLLRTTFIPRYTRLGTSFVATQVILEDELVPGKKTTMTISEISNTSLPNSVFTKSYVERVSR